MTRWSVVSLLRSLLLAAAASGLCLLSARRSWGTGPTAPGQEIQVNTQSERIQQSSCVALDAEGNFVVAWQSEVAGSGDEIRARRFDSRGMPRGEEFAVNTLTAGNQNAPAIAMNAGGDFVIAWQSLVVDDLVIRARRFNSHGVPQAGEFAVNTLNGNTHSAPAVAMDADGDFVVVWESALNGSYEIRARRFDSHGTARAGEFAVNTVTASSQRFPSAAMDADGDFVVVWRSNVAGSFEIRAQRFTAEGAAQGAELSVNALTAGDQLAPAVAMGAGGSFVVVWENSFDSSFEIRARRFSAAGVAQSDEVAVHPATAGNQFSPSVALGTNADFVVAWHCRVAGSFEIRARAFAANGVALGEELAINTVTAGTQKSAAVALDADGDFVVSWHSDATGSWEIAARQDHLRRRR